MLGHDVSSVHQTASHVLAVPGSHLTIVDAGLRTELVISAKGGARGRPTRPRLLGRMRTA
jgi:hypothetical protein